MSRRRLSSVDCGQNGNINAVINCEDALTRGSAAVILSRPSNEPVNTTPLFKTSTNSCYNPGTFTSGGSVSCAGGPIHGYGGKCVDVAGANPANGTAVQLYTCNGTTAQNWTHSGNTGQALGRCMDVTSAGTANGTKVQLYDCNGTAAQAWTVGASGVSGAVG